MRRDLRGRRVLLTGASRGIGRAAAQLLAQRGARLILAARTAVQLEEVAAGLRAQGACAFAVPTDLTSDGDRRRLLAAAQEHLGGLDVLVNNAGVASWGHFATSSEPILRQIMELNFFAPAELIRLAVPLLTEGVQPAILNVSSLCGKRGLPAWPEHSASKFALSGFTEAMRGEMARFDIDVLMLLPGLVRTEDQGRHLLRKDGRMALDFANATPPEVVADALVRALETNRTETYVGTDSRWISLANRLFPRFVDWLLARRVRRLYQEDSTDTLTPTGRLATAPLENRAKQKSP